MPSAGVFEGLGEELGAVGRAVVGHHPLDANALAFEPGERALQEGGGVFLSLAGQDHSLDGAKSESFQFVQATFIPAKTCTWRR